MTGLVFRALETVVSVEHTGGTVLAESLRTLTACYARDAGMATLRYRISEDDRKLYRDDTLIATAEVVEDLVAQFEVDLYQQALARGSAGWRVHAAALASAGAAVALVGPSGAGKSTLSLSLCCRGWRYLADDCVAIDAEGQIRGIRRPISLDVAWPDPLPEGFRASSIPLRQLEGFSEQHLVAPPPQRLADSASLAALIRIAHDPERATSTERLSPAEALCEIWPHTLRGESQVFERAIARLSCTPAYRIRTQDVDSACEAVDEVLIDALSRRGTDVAA